MPDWAWILVPLALVLLMVLIARGLAADPWRSRRGLTADSSPASFRPEKPLGPSGSGGFSLSG
jgi:hypothetical protein